MPEIAPERIGWDSYFLGIAEAVSKRGDCSRRQIGAVAVDKDRRVVSVGYNGVRPGAVGCLAGGCPRAQSSIAPGDNYNDLAFPCIATHAEASALLYADFGRLKGGTVYSSAEPCPGCRKLLQAVPILRAVWPEGVIEYEQY